MGIDETANISMLEVKQWQMIEVCSDGVFVNIYVRTIKLSYKKALR